MKFLQKVFSAIILLTVMAMPAFAEEKIVDVRLLLPSTEFEPGKSYPVLLKVVIDEEYHVNSNKPRQTNLIPTIAHFTTSDERATVGRVVYPKAKSKKYSFSPELIDVYDGTVYIVSSISFSKEMTGSVTVKAQLDYQACTDEACLLPYDATDEIVMNIGAGGQAINEELFKKYASGYTKKIKEISASSGGGGIFSNLDGSIGLTALLLIFLGGLALNLTPCVYPMIPITISYFGKAAHKSKMQTFGHALLYLFGMAIMYSALGVLAAVTGSLFGEFMQNTIVVIMLVAIMLALSASMFGMWEIGVPAGLMKLSTKKFGGSFGSLFMGLTAGIIMAPCVGPFVVGLLTFVGERQDPALGFLLFFVLAMGLGLPMVVLAMFSGTIKSLPRSGLWMEWVERFFGVVMIGMALYFAQPLMPGPEYVGYAAFSIASLGGIYLILAGRNVGGKVFNLFRFGIGFGMIAIGAWYLPDDSASAEKLPFVEYSKAEVQKAVDAKKPFFVDFTADWCLPCQELKIFTFNDPKVVKRQDEFVAMMVDLTRMDEREKRIKKEFNVVGVPTVILFDKNGKEAERFTGFIDADEFLEKLDKLM